jgi:hypothetical protein
MHTRRCHRTFAPLLTAALLAGPISAAAKSAEGTGVSLGFAAGAGIPFEDTSETDLAFGFFVDIPLVATFYLTPASVVYRVSGDWITDLDLNFKFIIPLGALELFAGLNAGPTVGLRSEAASGDPAGQIDFHVGGAGGVGYRLVSNVGLFAQGSYKLLLTADNQSVVQALGGIAFYF